MKKLKEMLRSEQENVRLINIFSMNLSHYKKRNAYRLYSNNLNC